MTAFLNSGTGRRSVVAALFVMAIILCLRAYYIATYALPVPFYDQWDAEGMTLLKPWMEGNLGWDHMFNSHNEHRILWSRLLSLAVFELGDGAWDNLSLALASSFVLAVPAGALTFLTWRSEAGLPARMTALVALLALGGLPFSWENILVGFQSQFYFMILWGVLGLTLAVYARNSLYLLATLPAAIACIFSMASGVICIGAMAAVVLTSRWQRDEVSPATLSCFFALLAIMACGYLLVPVIEPHQALRPQGLSDLVRAFVIGLSWPVGGAFWRAALIWIPSAVAAYLILRRRLPARIDHVMFGVALIAAGQALAIAVSRGNGMIGIPSRYTELLMLGIVANAWFLARLPALDMATGSRPLLKPAFALLAVAWAGLLVAGLVKRTLHDVASMSARHLASCEQFVNLGDYLRDRDPEVLKKPPLQVPYPSWEKLAVMAADPTLAPTLQHIRSSRNYPGCPNASTVMATPVDESQPGQPLPIHPGGSMAMAMPVNRDGRLVELRLLIGTYENRADGRLLVSACADGSCSEGAVELSTAKDNDYVAVPLTDHLSLRVGANLNLTLKTTGATHPVAVWGFGTNARSMTIADGDYRGHGVKAVLEYSE